MKKFLIFLLMLLLSTFVFAESVAFWVEDCGISTEITSIPAYLSIMEWRYEIDSLDGIEEFSEVQHLDLDTGVSASLNNSNIASLTNLESLYIHGNNMRLRSGDLKYLTHLPILSYGNSFYVEDNVFSGMSNLQSLHLSPFADFSRQIFPINMYSINLSGAVLRDLTYFSTEESLIRVNLNGSNLSQSAFNVIMYTEKILPNTFGEPFIKNVAITGSVNLEFIDFSCADLSDVADLSGITLSESLEELIFDGTIFSDSVIAGDYAEILNLIESMSTLNKLTIDHDVYLTRQEYFDLWDSMELNSLTIVPEPASFLLLTAGVLFLRKKRK